MVESDVNTCGRQQRLGAFGPFDDAEVVRIEPLLAAQVGDFGGTIDAIEIDVVELGVRAVFVHHRPARVAGLHGSGHLEVVVIASQARG